MENAMKLCIFENTTWENFLPLTFTRASFDLRCGVYSLRKRIAKYYSTKDISLLVREDLKRLYQERYPDFAINHIEEGDVLFLNGLLLYNKDIHQEIEQLNSGEALFYEDDLIAAKIRNPITTNIVLDDVTIMVSKFKKVKTHSQPITYIWQLIHRNSQQLIEDFHCFTKDKTNYLIQDGIFHVVNPDKIYLAKNNKLEPGVVLDASRGPVMIDEGSHIMANSVIKGPVYIGEKSQVNVGAKIYEGTNLGTFCKVGGEIEETIFQSYSNKQHDGFLGHSYVGEWVNIGADTNNSNLKNNYQSVKTYFYPTRTFKNTEMQFFGCVFGDHTKTGINVTLNTGTVIGVGCNLYSSLLFSGFIPSFSMGSADRLGDLRLSKMLETAQIVKNRRDLRLTEAERALLQSCYEESSDARKIFHKVKR